MKQGISVEYVRYFNRAKQECRPIWRTALLDSVRKPLRRLVELILLEGFETPEAV